MATATKSAVLDGLRVVARELDERGREFQVRSALSMIEGRREAGEAWFEGGCQMKDFGEQIRRLIREAE